MKKICIILIILFATYTNKSLAQDSSCLDPEENAISANNDDCQNLNNSEIKDNDVVVLKTSSLRSGIGNQKKNLSILFGSGVGIGWLSGSSVDKVYPEAAHNFNVYAGVKKQNKTLALFYSKLNAKGNPIDENGEAYDDVTANLKINTYGIQVTSGDVIYITAKLGAAKAKESFEFGDDVISKEISGTLVGADFGFRTKGALQFSASLNLHYYTFKTDQVHEGALIKEQKGFWNKGFSVGVRYNF